LIAELQATDRLDWINLVYQDEVDKSKTSYTNSSLSLSPPKYMALFEALQILEEHSNKRVTRVAVERSYPTSDGGDGGASGSCGYTLNEYRPLNRKLLHLLDRAKRIVKLLLESGGDLNLVDTGYGNRYLYASMFDIAAKSNDVDYMEWFLKYADAAINSPFLTIGGGWSGSYSLHQKETLCPIHRLIEEAQLSHLKLLMAHGADPNRKKLVYENYGYSSFNFGTKNQEVESSHTTLSLAVSLGVLLLLLLLLCCCCCWCCCCCVCCCVCCCCCLFVCLNVTSFSIVVAFDVQDHEPDDGARRRHQRLLRLE
jgi:hypothetical protein